MAENNTFTSAPCHIQSQLTYQYGVPMNESLFCMLLAFFAETPKSAENEEIDNLHELHILTVRFQTIILLLAFGLAKLMAELWFEAELGNECSN